MKSGWREALGQFIGQGTGDSTSANSRGQAIAVRLDSRASRASCEDYHIALEVREIGTADSSSSCILSVFYTKSQSSPM